jgi:type IX secretion system PorP/SprF family membrane protein
MKALFTIALFAFLPVFASAQYNMRPSAYYQDMLFYNPASIPSMEEENQRLLLYSRTKFVTDNEGIWDKSPTFYVDYLRYDDEKKSYFSIAFMNDNYSFFSRNTLYGGYGKKIALGSKSSITFGGRLALHSDVINWSDFKLPHNESGKSFRLSPDVDLGAQFQWKEYKLGASLKNAIGLAQKLDGEEIITTQRAIVINTSYDFYIKDKIIIAPYVLLYKEFGTVVDAGLFVNFYKRVNVSYLIRINELRSSFTLEGRIYKGLSVGACYDKSSLIPDNNLDIFVRCFF